MKDLRSTLVASLATAILCVSTSIPTLALAQQAPDNSGRNKAQSTTADNQSSAKSDRELTAKIRKAIIADKDLSTYAHNVKIITANGAVTLKGPVKSDDEKQKVAADAANVVSTDHITNNLTVKQ